MQLKVISFNIAGYKEWDVREQGIVEFIAAESPDVVLFQEVKFDPARSQYSQSILLNRLLIEPFPFTQTTVSKFYQPSHGDAFREGLAVLSRFPITNSEALVLTKRPDDKHPRIVQNVDLQIGDRQILVSNVHFSNNKYSLDQFKELMGILNARGEKRIIAGDFNMFHLEEARSYYEKDYTASVEFTHYVSFPSEGRALDYVLIPKELTFGSLATRGGLSDHSALIWSVETPAR